MSNLNNNNGGTSIKQPKMEVIDSIMDRKIGYGLYQKKALGFLSLIDFNDGLELVLISITLPIIRKEWNQQYSTFNEDGTIAEEYITTFTFQWLGAIFFLGNFVGALLTGILSDKFGRRKVVLVNSIAYGLIACSFLFVQELWELFALRFLYGFVYGITLPVSTIFYSEITPTKMRGRGVVVINSAIAIGQLFGVVLAACVLTDISHGDWRLLISLTCLPAFVLFYGAYYHLLESPRFLVCNKQIQEAAEIMNQMVQINRGDGGEIVTDDEVEELSNWRKRKYEPWLMTANTKVKSNNNTDEVQTSMSLQQLQQQHQQSSFMIEKLKNMFTKKYLMISISLCSMWFGIHMMSIGSIFILPMIQASASKGFGQLFLTFLGEVPGFILTFLIIDQPSLSRKNSLLIFFTGAGLMNLIAYSQISFGLALGLSRLAYRQCHGVLYVLTNELYETPLRSSAMGLNSALGRLATVVMPFILVPLYEYSTFSPFVFFVVLAVICAFMAFKLPFDTLAMKLDHVDEELLKVELSSHPQSLDKPLLSS